MNAPVSTLTRASGTILPADKQREKDGALVAFWNDGSAHALYVMENWAMGFNTGRSTPDSLTWHPEYTVPVWRAVTHIDDTEITGEGATAPGALADMMIRAEAKAAEFAQERYEDNMAGRG